MALHLVVAYETASCPELRAALLARASAEPEASFVLLVPATPRRRLLTYRRGQDIDAADKMAASAKLQFEAFGLKVLRAIAGDPDPISAISLEVRESQYASIIICTHPADVSRWSKAKVPQRAGQFGVPVKHIVIKSVAESPQTLGTSRTR